MKLHPLIFMHGRRLLRCSAFFILLLAGLEALPSLRAQSLPSHPVDSFSLEKVLCAIQERHAAVADRDRAVLVAMKERIANTPATAVDSDSGGITFACEVGDGNGGTAFFGGWINNSLGSTYSKAWYPDGEEEGSGVAAMSTLQTKIQIQIEKTTAPIVWQHLSTSYPNAQACANLSQKQVAELLEQARQQLDYLQWYYYVAIPAYAGAAQGTYVSHLVNTYPYYTKLGVRDEILELAARVSDLRTLIWYTIKSKETVAYRKSYFVQNTTPTHSGLRILGKPNDVDSATVNGIEVSCIYGSDVDERDNWCYQDIYEGVEVINDLPVHGSRLNFDFGYQRWKSTVGAGSFSGTVVMTSYLPFLGNTVLTDAGVGPEMVLGGKTSPHRGEFVWAVKDVSPNSTFTFQSGEDYGKTLFNDIGNLKTNGVWHDYQYPSGSDHAYTYRLSEEAKPPVPNLVGCFFKPDFSYTFKTTKILNPTLGKIGEVEVSAPRHFFQVYLGPADSILGEPTFLRLEAAKDINWSHPRHLRFIGNQETNEVIHSWNSEDMADPVWTEQTWPPGDLEAPYADWGNYEAYKYGISLIRQVLTKNTLVDVKKVNQYKYEIKIYPRPAVLEKNEETGRYSISGNPLKIITVSNPNNSYDLLTAVEIETDGIKHKLVREAVGSGFESVYTRRAGASPVFYQEKYVVASQFSSGITTVTKDGLESEGQHIYGDADYYNQVDANVLLSQAYHGHLSYFKSNSAAGSVEYSIDGYGDISQMKKGPQDMTSEEVPDAQIQRYPIVSETDVAYRTEAKKGGAVVGIGWKVEKKLTEERYVKAVSLDTSGPDAAGNLTTTVYYNDGEFVMNPWSIKAVKHPDGTATVYEYATNGNDRDYVTISTGQPTNASGIPTAILKGRKEVLTYNKQGVLVGTTIKDVASDLVFSNSLVTEELDFYGYPQKTEYSDGTETAASYASGKLASIKDRWGKTTTIEKDGLERVKKLTRDNLHTEFEYNTDNHFGSLVTFPDGSSVRETRDGFGIWQSSQAQFKTLSMETTSDPSGSAATEVTDSFGDRHYESTTDSGGLTATTEGNGLQPFDQDMEAAGIPGTTPSVQGLKVTSTHKQNGSATGIQIVSYYDGVGRLQRQEQPGGSGNTAATVYKYNGAQLKSMTDPDGVVTIYEYNTQGDLSGIVRSLSKSETVHENEDQIVRFASSEVEGKWESSFSIVSGGNARIVERKVWDPDSRETEIYPDNDSGRKITVPAPVWNATTSKLTLASSGPLAQTEETYSDGSLEMSSITSGGITRQMAATLNNLGETTKVVESGTGPSTELNFNTGNNTLSSSKVGSRTRSYSYSNRNGGGIELGVTQGSVDQTSFWNAKNEFLGQTGDNVIDFLLSETSIGGGRITRDLTLGGSQTNFSTNLGGGDFEKAYSDDATETSEFSAAGRPRSWTNARGQKTEFLSDDAGQINGVNLPGSETDWAFPLRQDGLVESISDASGTRTLGYDTKGRLHTVTYGTGSPLAGKIITYGYDSAGRRSSLSVTGGDSVSYTYAGLQLTGVTNTTASRSASFTGTALPNGIPKNMEYGLLSVAKTVNANGELTQIASTTESLSLGYSYGYDSNGKRNAVDFDGNKRWELGYASDGQLETAVKKQGETTQLNYSYAVSGTGNPTGKTLNGVSSIFSAGPAGLNQVAGKTYPNRSVTVTGSVAPAGTPPESSAPAATVKINGVSEAVLSDGSFNKVLGSLGDSGGWVNVTVEGRIAGAGDEGHDAVAEETQKLWLPPLNETLSHDEDGNRGEDSKFNYEWDSQNRLKSVTEKVASSSEGALKLEYAYDSQGRRFSKQVKRGAVLKSETLFVYDGWRLLLEEQKNGAGVLQLKRSYTWGPDLSGSLDGAGGIGGLLEIAETKGSTTTRSLPVFDGSGNVIALVDASSGAKVAEYEYGMFGEPLVAKGPRSESCPLRFSTKYYESETGFYYFGYRYYDPQTRQWVSRDPLGEAGGVNLYAYCGNDPVNAVDPNGLEAIIFISDPADYAKAILFQQQSEKGPRDPIWRTSVDVHIVPLFDKESLEYRLYFSGMASHGIQYDGKNYYGGSILGPNVAWFFSDRSHFDYNTNIANNFKALHQMTLGASMAVGVRFSAPAQMLTKGAPTLAQEIKLVSKETNWINRFPGVQVRKFGNYWIKRINPEASPLMQKWGQSTINSQADALSMLRTSGSPAANSKIFPSGRLVMEDVGGSLGYSSYFDASYWGARFRDSRAMGTIFNDLRPGNYGLGFRAFDPALDPWVGTIGIGGGITIGGGVLWWTLGNDEE